MLRLVFVDLYGHHALDDDEDEMKVDMGFESLRKGDVYKGDLDYIVQRGQSYTARFHFTTTLGTFADFSHAFDCISSHAVARLRGVSDAE